MVLSKLSESLRKSLDNLKSNKLDKNTVEDLNSNIKKALIQSDVSLDLVKTLNNTIEKRALNEKVSAGLSARDHVVNIVYEELTKLLGTKFVELDTSKKPSIIMMVGLFGAGKTTTTGKLAKRLKKSGKKIALIQTDTWRPAAYSQLKQLSEAIKIDFYGDPDERDPVKIYEKFENELKKYEIIIVDTAGRDSLNDELTSEIVELNKKIKANEKLLVLSGDIGQSAKKIAESFEKNVGITGIIITKLDGTAKGGGALSASAATNSNIKFIGTGEKLDNLEEFKPKNFVSRLLGMGDLETLLEKAKDAINSE
ncbi:MAG: signal recognition particle receptor subunit alpha, partial [Candidatus Woesearchaeota archaeon]